MCCMQIRRSVTQYQKHGRPSGSDLSSPPLPPRNYLPFSQSPPLPPRTRTQDQLFSFVPPPASATGVPVPVPRTSLKKLVTSPGPLLDMASTEEDTLQPPPPQRSSSTPVFTETSHYWTLAEVAAGTSPHCR